MNKIKNILGLTILEGLVSTAIVGIGFIAILQMVNYSVQSIDTSGERTKANYLVSMMAEDVIGHKNSIYGIDSLVDKVAIGIDGTVTVNQEERENARKFSDHLYNTEFFSGACGSTQGLLATAAGDTDPDAGNQGNQGPDNSPPTSIYGTQHKDGPSNKDEKWRQILGESRYLKCRGDRDIKKLKMYKICRWEDTCTTYSDSAINDNGMYIGRIQVNMNDGKKRKFLYFQADFNTRK
tara:strand:- start:163 stop:873 length:711 start_codon:yes stop_codon:yes gene_type:complete